MALFVAAALAAALPSVEELRGRRAQLHDYAWHDETSPHALLKFQLFVPADFADPERGASELRPPVLVFLHGRGESGGYEVTNAQSLPWQLLHNRTFASRHPFVTLLPQCPLACAHLNGWQPQTLQMTTRLVREWVVPTLGADATRVSLAGQSMGGNGALIYAAQQPSFFCAVVVVCGYAGTPDDEAAIAARVARDHLPLAVYHSADDSVIPVAAADTLVHAMRRAHHPVRYVRYEHAPPPPMDEFSHLVGHGSYQLAFNDAATYAWLLEQRCARCARSRHVVEAWTPLEEEPPSAARRSHSHHRSSSGSTPRELGSIPRIDGRKLAGAAHTCVRRYNRSLWGRECELRERQAMAIHWEHKRTGCVNSHARVRGSVCNMSLAGEIGVAPFPRSMWQRRPQRREFLQRLTIFRRMKGAHHLGHPNLSFGDSLRGLQSSERCDGPMHCGVHFWGAYWADASIYTHFFANSGPGGGPVRDGVYVEIGGQHGLDGSNTLFFEQHLDWSGTLIEPTACATCLLPHTRPRDRVVHAAACVDSTVIPGLAHLGVLGSPNARFCVGYDGCVADAPGGYSNYSTPCEPMHRLLEPLPPRIDFFSIDVEEHVMAVLTTIPFDKVDIDVLLVEAARGKFNYNREAIDLLHANGYEILGERSPHKKHCVFGGDLVAVKRACVDD